MVGVGGGGSLVSSQTRIWMCNEVSMATLTQPTTHAPIILIDSEHTLTIWAGRDGSRDPQRSANNEIPEIRNEQQMRVN